MSQIKFEPLQISSFGDEALAAPDASFRSKEVFEIGGKLFSLSGVSHHWTGAAIGRVSAVADHVSVPANPAWTGEGLPPVGTVCEYQNSLGSWFPVEITAIAKKGICFVQTERDGENYVCQVSSKFRPIRTPEQIEAEARRSAIGEMLRSEPAMTICMAGNLYDAGYRKFEIVENEE